jgi:Lon protease-like protein
MRGLSPVRLLSLASVVPFPGGTYLVGCRSRDVCGDGSITVGLRQRGSAVGCVATATAVSDEMVCCKASAQRFRLSSAAPRATDDGELHSVDPLDDDLEDLASAEQLRDEVWLLVEQLEAVHAANAGACGHLDPAESPASFSFALASGSELDLAELQALLECTSARERLSRLKTWYESAVAFAATQKALRALASGFGQ